MRCRNQRGRGSPARTGLGSLSRSPRPGAHLGPASRGPTGVQVPAAPTCQLRRLSKAPQRRGSQSRCGGCSVQSADAFPLSARPCRAPGLCQRPPRASSHLLGAALSLPCWGCSPRREQHSEGAGNSLEPHCPGPRSVAPGCANPGAETDPRADPRTRTALHLPPTALQSPGPTSPAVGKSPLATSLFSQVSQEASLAPARPRLRAGSEWSQFLLAVRGHLETQSFPATTY